MRTSWIVTLCGLVALSAAACIDEQAEPGSQDRARALYMMSEGSLTFEPESSEGGTSGTGPESWGSTSGGIEPWGSTSGGIEPETSDGTSTGGAPIPPLPPPARGTCTFHYTDRGTWYLGNTTCGHMFQGVPPCPEPPPGNYEVDQQVNVPCFCADNEWPYDKCSGSVGCSSGYGNYPNSSGTSPSNADTRACVGGINGPFARCYIPATLACPPDGSTQSCVDDWNVSSGQETYPECANRPTAP
jgi:hypothetical protein